MTDHHKPSHDHQPFRLRHLLTQHTGMWIVAWVLGISTVLSVLGLVAVAGWFITISGVVGILAVGFNYFMPSALIRLFAIVRTMARYGDLMVSHHAVFDLLKALRVRFFSHWVKLPLSARTNDTQTSSQKMHRLVKDIDTLDEFVLRLVSPFVVACVAVLATSVMMAIFLPKALFAVLLFVVALALPLFAFKIGKTLAFDESTLKEQHKTRLLDTLPALTQLLTWGRWDDQVRHFEKLEHKQTTLHANAHRLKRQTAFCIQICMALAVVGILAVANGQFNQNIIAFSADNINHYANLNPALVLGLVLMVVGLVEMLVMLGAEPLAWGRSLRAKSQINALITPHTTPTPKTPLAHTSSPTIVLDNVHAQIPNAITGAKGVCATLSHQKPTLIMGASGAGKSTLLATLAGELPLVGGQITFNDIDYLQVDFGDKLGFLGQTVDIFDQTLGDNLRLGKPDAHDDELLAVLKKVNLHTWFLAQPKGFDTPLGEYGMAISGGQARRIALARLLLRPKTILLLDEPFAGLDHQSRQIVWQSLTNMQQNGEIGILAITTHQRWADMQADIITID